MTQIVASVLAAVSATVAASYFGVAGTVVGAALGSVISVVGGALYKHSIDRTKDRIKAAAVESAVAQRFGIAETAVLTPSRWRSIPFSAKPVLAATVALFVLVIGGVTAFEMLTGQPLSSTVKGNTGSGTSLIGGTHHNPTPGNTKLPVSTPAASQNTSTSAATTSASAPSAGPTATVTVTQTPTASGTGATGTAATPTDTAIAPHANPSATPAG
jgi:hypothetical protein